MNKQAIFIYFKKEQLVLIFLLINILPFCLSTVNAESAENNTKKRILVIHSYEETLVSYPDYNRLIVEYLKKGGISADLDISYLDCESVWGDQEMEKMNEIIESANPQPDIIMVTGDQAAFSLMSCKHPFLKTIPIVFTGVKFPNWKLLHENPNVTGIWDKPDYIKNLQVIKKVMGDRHVRFFYDKTFLGRQIVSRLSEQFNDDKVLSVYLNRFLQKQDSVIMKLDFGNKSSDKKYTSLADNLYFINMRDEIGRDLLWNLSGIGLYRNSVFLLTKYDYTVAKLGFWATVPVFSSVNKGVGYAQNIIGGYFTTLEDEAAEGCAYVVRLLKGEDISKLPVKESPKKVILDWEVLKRWNVPVDRLPADYHIINMPFYVKYRSVAIILAVVIPLLVIALFCYLLFLYLRESRRKKQVQSDLEEEKKFLSLALEGGHIFAWRYDTAENTFIFDKEFVDNIDLESRRIKLDEMTRMTHPDDVEYAMDKFIRTVNKLEDMAIIRVRMNFNQKGYIWYEFRALNISGILADQSSVIGTVMNIQDFKDREEELIEARNLAAKMELKQSFLANMSHEIRTPLNAIVGFSNILVNVPDIAEEEKKGFIVSINDNCGLLLKLIDDILEISRIESGNMSFELELSSLNGFIDDVYRTHQIMIPESIEFVKIPLANDAIINTDTKRLKQVISNFINNALKFTSAGRVIVGAVYDKMKKEICIYVEDTGIGIPLEEQEMIFERFYKRDEFVQGTGLGLSISQVIADKLNGKITLSSEEGKGSRFAIVFPFDETEAEEVISGSDSGIQIQTDGSGPVVLIAEDSVTNYLLLNSILKEHCSIIWAINGKDAVNIVNKQHVDLILMDIKMQEMDGLTALRKIRKKFRKMPVIMQTAYASEENRKAAEEAGASGFIVKPVMANELLKVVGQFITLK